MCTDFIAPTFQLLQVHLFRVHSGNFNVTCCCVHFRSASAYRKHLQRHHRELVDRQVVNDASESSTITIDQDQDVVEPEEMDQPNKKLNTALWIMKMKEKQKLTQLSLDKMLHEITELCIAELGESVKTVIETAGLQVADIPGLEELFTPSSSYCNPFADLDTCHKQISFYADQLNLIVSVLATFCSYYVRIIMLESCTSVIGDASCMENEWK